MRVLLATDGSECSENAAREVAGRPWPEGSEIHVVSVVEPPISVAPETWILPEGYYEEIERAAHEQGAAAVEAAARIVAEAQGDRVHVTKRLVTGVPKRALLEHAEEIGADLIVLGSHGYRAFERFLLGSVSQSVAQHAKCSVEIVRGSTCAGSPEGED
jgi:nucleotide-binding universal stress UspA family protein